MSGSSPSIRHTTQIIGFILVVDDESIVRDMLSSILTKQGYTVLLAGTGQEALQLCEQHAGAIQLLITDMLMPGMNGLELVRKVHAQWPQLRVLYLSGSRVVGEGFEREPDLPFLTKPFPRAELIAKVRELLKGTPGAG